MFWRDCSSLKLIVGLLVASLSNLHLKTKKIVAKNFFKKSNLTFLFAQNYILLPDSIYFDAWSNSWRYRSLLHRLHCSLIGWNMTCDAGRWTKFWIPQQIWTYRYTWWAIIVWELKWNFFIKVFPHKRHLEFHQELKFKFYLNLI